MLRTFIKLQRYVLSAFYSMLFLSAFVLIYLILGLRSTLGCFYVRIFCFFDLPVITWCYNYCDWKLSDISRCKHGAFLTSLPCLLQAVLQCIIWLAFKHNLVVKEWKIFLWKYIVCSCTLFVYSEIPNCLWYIPCSFSDIVQLYLLLVIFHFNTKLNWLIKWKMTWY